MDAKQFHAELTALTQRAVNEGIAEGKLGFQTAIGIVDDAKQSIYEWRMQGRIMETIETMMGVPPAPAGEASTALIVDPKTGKPIGSGGK